MALPVYQTINIRSSSLDDLAHFLDPAMNQKHPVSINIKTLELDQQREVIGLIENFFVSHNISFKFPYPIYMITDHESSITEMPTVKAPELLPKFFTQKEGKMNVKESHLISKNKLLQQEVINSDALANQNSINIYSATHKKIHNLEIERQFYHSLLNRIVKGKKNG